MKRSIDSVWTTLDYVPQIWILNSVKSAREMCWEERTAIQNWTLRPAVWNLKAFHPKSIELMSRCASACSCTLQRKLVVRIWTHGEMGGPGWSCPSLFLATPSEHSDATKPYRCSHSQIAPDLARVLFCLSCCLMGLHRRCVFLLVLFVEQKVLQEETLWQVLSALLKRPNTNGGLGTYSYSYKFVHDCVTESSVVAGLS